jgi:hypothetical protein
MSVFWAHVRRGQALTSRGENLPQEIVAEIDDLPDHARMRTLFITLALVGFGCGDDGTKPAIDAAPPVVDAAPDAAPVVALDCPTYCNQIQANCTGANAQYPDMGHCIGTCASFTVGTSKVTDTAGNTLGCRIYHGGTPSMTMPAMHCVHAGPGGDLITLATPAVCSGGDTCASFCALEVKACGTLAAPIAGIPAQYQDAAACMTACAGFDKTHAYGTTAAGNSLACRLYHATNAAVSATTAVTHCPHTAATPTGPCAGVAAP